jgi:hypothetical protein
MEKATLNSRIIKTEPIPWRDLRFIQQDDFKAWTPNGGQKLHTSLLRYQFIDPFKVWESEGVIYCLDGRHRYMDLLAIAEAGNEVPEMLPATFIDCQDKKEAAELVLIYSSRYASITETGLLDFVKEYAIQMPDLIQALDIPDLDIQRFMGDISKDFSSFNEELQVDSFKDEVILKLTFSREEYIEVKAKIVEVMGTRKLSRAEDLFKDLLFAANI